MLKKILKGRVLLAPFFQYHHYEKNLFCSIDWFVCFVGLDLLYISHWTQLAHVYNDVRNCLYSWDHYMWTS